MRQPRDNSWRNLSGAECSFHRKPIPVRIGAIKHTGFVLGAVVNIGKA
jgi:hypothetical protein